MRRDPLKTKSPAVSRWVDGLPVVVARDGRIEREQMTRLRVDEDDILEAARILHGLERMEQIKHAVVERGGAISIVPRDKVSE